MRALRLLILTMTLLVMAGCSDGDSAFIEKPKVVANQTQPTATPEPMAAIEFAPTPRPAPTRPVPTPEPVSSNRPASAPTPDPLEDPMLQDSIWLLKHNPDLHYYLHFTLEWVADGVTESEREDLALLLHIGVALENVSEEFIRIQWLKDGMNEDESRALLKLGGVADHSDEAARIIMEMDWFTDEVAEDESWVINAFNNIVREDTDAAIQTLELPWFADGLDEYEIRAVRAVGRAAYYSWDMARRVIELPSFTDGVDGYDESWLFNAFGLLAEHNSDTAIRIMETPWFMDGLDEYETLAVRSVGGIANESGTAAERVSNLPWFMDGPDKTDSWIINALGNVSNHDPGGVVRIMDLPWFRDGLNHDEATSLVDIGNIAHDRGEAAHSILGMPFLRTFEPSDAVALESLGLILLDSPEDFDRIISHPNISDGITDDETPLIAPLHHVIQYNPALAVELLDPNRALLEDRTIDLPLAGETWLTIVRAQPGSPDSMDALERAIRAIEGYMGAPFPTNFVLLLFADALPDDSDGLNFRTNIAIHPKYDVGDDNEMSEFALHVIAHEAARYYWRGGPLWLDEGAANLLAFVARGYKSDDAVDPYNPPCAIASNISALEPANPTEVNDLHVCHSALGERLFLDLRRALGEDEFQKGFRALYLSVDDFADIEAIPPRGIDHLRDAFRFSPVATDTIIPKWFDGVVERDQ